MNKIPLTISEEAKDQGYTPYFPKDAEPDWKKVTRHNYE